MEGGPKVNRALLATAGILLIVLAAGCTRYVRIDDLAQEYYNLGNAFYELEDYEKAEGYYLRALELDPEFERAGFNLARALAEQGRYSEALTLLEELLEEDPGNLRIMEAAAYVEYRRGDFNAAVAGYEAVLERSPFRPDALYNLGVLLLEDGAEVQARRYLAQAYEVSPEDPDVLYAYSESLFRTGRRQTGLSILDELRTADDLPPEYLRSTARRYAEAEFFADALALYDRLLLQEPADGEAHFEKASILLTAAEEGDAGLEALEDALESGFADLDRLGELLEEESLIRGEDIRDLLAEFSLEVVEPGAEANAEPEAGAPTDGAPTEE